MTTSADSPAMDADAEGESSWGREALGALWGGVKLLLGFTPEILLALLGGTIGLIVGIIFGITMTAELFEGGGTWARAGPIALILPLMTSVGPVVVCTLVGLLAPPLVVLPLHAFVLAVRAKNHHRPRHVPIYAGAVFGLLPFLLFLIPEPGETSSRLGQAVILSGIVSPLTITMGAVLGTLYVGVAGILKGRSLGRWWEDADASMGMALFSLSVYTWVVTWFVCFLFCLVPTIPFTLGLALILGFRLFLRDQKRLLVGVITVVNVLHLLVWCFGAFAVVHAEPQEDQATQPSENAE